MRTRVRGGAARACREHRPARPRARLRAKQELHNCEAEAEILLLCALDGGAGDLRVVVPGRGRHEHEQSACARACGVGALVRAAVSAARQRAGRAARGGPTTPLLQHLFYSRQQQRAKWRHVARLGGLGCTGLSCRCRRYAETHPCTRLGTGHLGHPKHMSMSIAIAYFSPKQNTRVVCFLCQARLSSVILSCHPWLVRPRSQWRSTRWLWLDETCTICSCVCCRHDWGTASATQDT